MALTQRQINILVDRYMIGLYDELEREVIHDIARRVKKTGRYTETAELMAKAMRLQGYSPQKIQREVLKVLNADKEYKRHVAEETKAYKHEVKRIIDETTRQAALKGDKLVGSAGQMAWNDDLRVWKQHGIDLQQTKVFDQLVKAYRMQTRNSFRNLSQGMGFVNTLLGRVGVMQMYQRGLDLAILEVATGTFSFDDAVRRFVENMAQSGLRYIDYASGRSYNIDTAARMNIRTGVSQLAGKITEMNIKKTGVNLVYVDAHGGSRPEHATWQGHVYTYQGKPSGRYPDFFKSTGYGTVTGLKGANCTHNFYPHWEGDDIPQYTPPQPVNVGGQTYTMYEATQKQRSMERDIRATKRKIDALNSIGQDTTALKGKLQTKTKDYRTFSRQAGLNPKDNRLNAYY